MYNYVYQALPCQKFVLADKGIYEMCDVDDNGDGTIQVRNYKTGEFTDVNLSDKCEFVRPIDGFNALLLWALECNYQRPAGKSYVFEKEEKSGRLRRITFNKVEATIDCVVLDIMGRTIIHKTFKLGETVVMDGHLTKV